MPQYSGPKYVESLRFASLLNTERNMH